MSRIIQEAKRDPDTWQLLEPAVARCDCGARVHLGDSWANECGRCGREYNGSGQLLAPRSQWGWETGEEF
jgi:hypothetical protein